MSGVEGSEAMSEFKRRACGDQMVSLGPVWSVNPKCVEKIVVYDDMDHDSFLEIHGFITTLTTELETRACCERMVAELLAINPDIEIERQHVLVTSDSIP